MGYLTSLQLQIIVHTGLAFKWRIELHIELLDRLRIEGDKIILRESFIALCNYTVWIALQPTLT